METPQLEADAAEAASCRDIFEAATSGKLGALRHLLRETPSLVEVKKNGFGDRPLQWALYCRQVEAAQLLLAARADVDAKGQDGQTPLDLAVAQGFTAIAQQLREAGAASSQTDLHLAAAFGKAQVAAGADLNATDCIGLTPLHAAAGNDQTEAMQRLLEARAAVDAEEDKHRSTPLHLAAHNGHGAVVQVLLDAGASAEATDEYGMTPLHWAAENGHGAAVQVLLDAGASVEATDNDGQRPLHRAAENGHGAAAQVLLDAGASVEAEDKSGMTPLHWAAVNGHGAAVQVLLDAGASADAKDNTGMTPLHCAAVNGHGAAVQVLLDAGASVEATDAGGRMPLHLAALKGHGAAVQVLLDAGAPVEATDNNYGWTPLHLAAVNGHGAVVQVLLDAGASAEATDGDGRTPLNKALQRGHGHLRRVLRPVTVAMLSGRTAKCDSSEDRTVQELMDEAQKELAVRISHLVTPAGETLKPSSTLGELGLEQGGEVTGIIMQEEAQSHGAEVAVSTKSGRTVVCKATAHTTIQELLHEAQQKLGLEILQLAAPAGHVLSPQSLLSDADLDNENRLTAILAQDGQDETGGCSLDDPQSLIDFVTRADIGLIRLDFLIELQARGEVLPRRQEAESARTASGLSALVQRDELRSLSVDSIGRVRQGADLVQFVSISHAWECREHPDPHGFQLGQIVGTLLLGNMNAGVTWVFYDYTSLFQYKRRTQREEDSFRRAMQGMHQLYANEIVNVLIVDGLTPSENRTRTHVVTYFEEEDRVVRRPIEDLIGNNTPYGDRGWCRAEREWSRLRADLAGGVPTPPDLFARWINSMVFTHRSDAQAVIDLQRQVFEEKVATARNLLVKDLGQAELQALRGALPHYQNLENVVIIGCPLRSLDAIAAVETGATEIQMTSCGLGDEAAVALASAVRERSKQPETINLARNRIGQVGQEALKTLMREIPSLKIDMSEQDEALESSTTPSLAGPAGSALRKAKPQGLGPSG